MEPALRGLVLWIHLAGVVVWFGAVAYFLLVLRPAVLAALALGAAAAFLGLLLHG